MGKSDVNARNILGGEGAKQAVPSKVITRSGTYDVKSTANGGVELTNSSGVKAVMKSPTQITPANMKNIPKVANAAEKMGINEITSNNVKISKGTQAGHTVTDHTNHTQKISGLGMGGAIQSAFGGGGLAEETR